MRRPWAPRWGEEWGGSKKVNVVDLYSASSWEPRSGVDHTVLPANNTTPAFSRSSPGGATTEWTVTAPADEAYYSLIDLVRMKGWVGHVGWPIADVWPTKWSSVQLAVRRRTGKVHRSKTIVLLLCYAAKKYPPSHPTMGSGRASWAFPAGSRTRFNCNLISADRLCWQQITENSSPFRPEKWGYGTPQSKKWGVLVPP